MVANSSLRTGVALLAATIGTYIYTAGGAFLTVALAPAARDMGLVATQAGLILSSGAFAAVILAPAWGYASERLGRRMLMLLATAMVALSPAVMAVVFGRTLALEPWTVFAVLVAARLVQSAFGAALIPLTQGYVAALTSAERRIGGMGFMTVAVTLGTVSGSALVAITAKSGMAVGLATVAELGFAALIVVALGLPEGRPAPNLPAPERAVPVRRIWPYIGITVAGYAAYTMVGPLLGLRLIDRLGLSTADAIGAAGLILALGGLAQALTQGLVMVRLPWRPATLLWLGCAGALVGLAGLIASTSLVAIGVALVAIGAFLGLVAPANLALLSLAAGRGAQGKVAGINASARGLGIALGPISGTALYTINHDLPLYGSGTLIVLAIVLAVVSARIDRAQPATADAASS